MKSNPLWRLIHNDTTIVSYLFYDDPSLIDSNDILILSVSTEFLFSNKRLDVLLIYSVPGVCVFHFDCMVVCIDK